MVPASDISTARWQLLVVLGCACAALLVGCGDGSSQESSTSRAVAGPPSTVDESPTTTGIGGSSGQGDIIEVIDGAAAGEVSAVVARVPVGATVSYAGFDIEVHDVLIGYDPAQFYVAQVNVTLANRTKGRARLSTAVEIDSQGFVAATDRDATPDVEAGAAAAGYFSIRLDSGFSLDDAILFIGRPDRNRVQIPLGSNGELVTRAAIVSEDSIGAGTDLATVTIDSIVVSWDSADPRSQSEPGSAFIAVEYTFSSSVATVISGDVVTLRLPSGTEVTPIASSIEQVDAGSEIAGLSGVFPIDDPFAGDYVLVYSERFGKGTLEIPFTLS